MVDFHKNFKTTFYEFSRDCTTKFAIFSSEEINGKKLLLFNKEIKDVNSNIFYFFRFYTENLIYISCENRAYIII